MTIETAIEFPSLLLRERSVSWRVSASTFSPGQSATGAFSLSRMDGGGLWLADLMEINLRTREHVACFRAVAALAENGVVPIVLPMCERRYFPAPVVDGGRLLSYDPVPHSDDTLFSDGSGYYQPVVVAQTVGAVALRATSMTIEFIVGSELIGGEKFSILHESGQGQGWRLYEIKTAVLNDSGNWDVTFRPPIRDDVASGTAVEFDIPRCTMRLAKSDAMDVALEQRKYGSPSVGFVEYFYPDS